MIHVKVDDSATRRMLIAASKQARYAAAVALTRTAGVVKDDLARKMREVLPGASPYSLKSQYIRPAKPQNLTAVVGIKDIKPGRGVAPATLVREHFTGGLRGHKPMEVAMAAMGALPNGWHVVPGPGIKLDRYGNPSKAAVAEILGALRRRVNVVGRRGKTTVTKGYFVVTQGAPRAAHLAPGIWRRVNNRAITPMFLFVDRAAYRKRIDLPALARKAAREDFPRLFDAAYRQALATAR